MLDPWRVTEKCQGCDTLVDAQGGAFAPKDGRLRFLCESCLEAERTLERTRLKSPDARSPDPEFGVSPPRLPRPTRPRVMTPEYKAMLAEQAEAGATSKEAFEALRRAGFSGSQAYVAGLLSGLRKEQGRSGYKPTVMTPQYQALLGEQAKAGATATQALEALRRAGYTGERSSYFYRVWRAQRKGGSGLRDGDSPARK